MKTVICTFARDARHLTLGREYTVVADNGGRDICVHDDLQHDKCNREWFVDHWGNNIYLAVYERDVGGEVSHLCYSPADVEAFMSEQRKYPGFCEAHVELYGITSRVDIEMLRKGAVNFA